MNIPVAAEYKSNSSNERGQTGGICVDVAFVVHLFQYIEREAICSITAQDERKKYEKVKSGRNT